MWLAPVLLADYWSPRINDQWRIVFRWDGKEALDVEITDYYRWDEMLPKKRPPTHPGQMLLKEFLEPLGFEHRFRDDSVTVSTAAMQDLTDPVTVRYIVSFIYTSTSTDRYASRNSLAGIQVFIQIINKLDFCL